MGAGGRRRGPRSLRTGEGGGPDLPPVRAGGGGHFFSSAKGAWPRELFGFFWLSNRRPPTLWRSLQAVCLGPRLIFWEGLNYLAPTFWEASAVFGLVRFGAPVLSSSRPA